MLDKEKIIKGLKCCDSSDTEQTCFDCPYVKHNRREGMRVCTSMLAHDVLELLEKQEPQFPVTEIKRIGPGLIHYELDWSHKCPRCNAVLAKGPCPPTGKIKSCQKCGQAVKWD